MGASDLGQRFDGSAVERVVPAVGDRADLLEAERSRHVAGHSVGVDEEHLLAMAELERGRQARGDRRLADAALGVEDGDHGRPPLPLAQIDVAGLDHRTRAVVNGGGTNAHRLDPPAQRIDRVRSAEVLVLDAAAGAQSRQPIECPRREDHQRRDLAPAVAEQRVVLERCVEVALAIENRDGDVAARPEERVQIVRAVDRDRIDRGVAQLGQHLALFVCRESDGDGRSRHDSAPDVVPDDQWSDSGWWAVTLSVPSPDPVTRAWKLGRLGIASRRTMSVVWWTAKRNSPSGPDETPTDLTPASRPRWRLKLAMLATLTRPVTTTCVVTVSPEPLSLPPGSRSARRAARASSPMTGISSMSPVASADAAASASAASKSVALEPPSSSWAPTISIAMSATASARSAASVATSALAAASAAAWIAANAASRSTSKSAGTSTLSSARSSADSTGSASVSTSSRVSRTGVASSAAASSAVTASSSVSTVLNDTSPTGRPS